jgi:hypothetical protein
MANPYKTYEIHVELLEPIASKLKLEYKYKQDGYKQIITIADIDYEIEEVTQTVILTREEFNKLIFPEYYKGEKHE